MNITEIKILHMMYCSGGLDLKILQLDFFYSITFNCDLSC